MGKHHKGAQMHLISLAGGLMNGPLSRMAAKLPPEPRKPKPEAKRRGKTTIPDEVIIAVRRRHEIDGATFTTVCAEFPDLQPVYVRSILEYSTREHLRVK